MERVIWVKPSTESGITDTDRCRTSMDASCIAIYTNCYTTNSTRMPSFTRLTLTSQTLYAELLEQALALEASRSAANLPGTFTTRAVKGRRYHYYVYRDLAGKYRQVYLGPDSDEVRSFVERVRTEKREASADFKRVEELCAALDATGAMVAPHSHAKVIQALTDSGLFRFGMVLVGSHAFAVIGNMLGVRWSGVERTQDVDFVYDPDIDVGVADAEELNIPDVLKSLEMGFIPIPKLNHRHPSTSFRVRGKELRIDFLTPMPRKPRDQPVFLPHLHAAADPLQYLDYLIGQPQTGVVIANRGILVNVPNAGRFALHKLIVSSVRKNRVKAEKDVHQAAQLSDVLLESKAGDLSLAWKALEARGKSWTARFKDGLKRLTAMYPATGKELAQRFGVARSERGSRE